ncbi:PqiC family protein [Rheinheimera salexigens]|nr:ABC-type transport auxiliary lipoprotein family protein [Rheinheimera salexigens]
MRMFNVFVLVLVMLTAVTACSSSVSVDYYQLSTAKLAHEAKSNDQSVFIPPVQVASYLNSKSLIMQMSSVQLVLARQHLWAEPLDQQIQRKLANSLEASNQGYVIALKPSSDAVTLVVSVEQFHGTAEGYAVLRGRYSLQPAFNHGNNKTASDNVNENASKVKNYTFSYQLPLQADGYPALVISLSQAVEQLAEDILQQLTKPASI